MAKDARGEISFLLAAGWHFLSGFGPSDLGIVLTARAIWLPGTCDHSVPRPRGADLLWLLGSHRFVERHRPVPFLMFVGCK